MATFTDKQELDRQGKIRQLNLVTDPKKLRALKAAGFDAKGRSTGWGKFMDWVDPFATVHMRNAVAKKNLKGTDGYKVFSETRDEFTNMNLGQHKFTADIFKTILGSGIMGGKGSAGAGAGASGATNAVSDAGSSAGANALGAFGSSGGMDVASGAGSAMGGGAMDAFSGMGQSGGGFADAISGIGDVQKGMKTAGDIGEEVGGVLDDDESSIAGTSNGNLRKNYPEGTRVGDDGYLYDQAGNRIDYDIEEENNSDLNKFNNIANDKEKNKKMWGDNIKGILDPNADLVGSATNMVTAGVDYYGSQKSELNKLRGQNVMDQFTFL